MKISLYNGNFGVNQNDSKIQIGLRFLNFYLKEIASKKLTFLSQSEKKLFYNIFVFSIEFYLHLLQYRTLNVL